MDDAREKAVSRVKALLKMNVANGCTEQEADSALLKAREIMKTYGITEPEVGLPTRAQVDAARNIVERRTAQELIVSVAKEMLPDKTYLYTVSLSGSTYGRVNLPATSEEEALALADGLVTITRRNLWITVRRA